MARAWVAEFHARTGGHPVLIYLPHWVWADHLGSPGGLSGLGPLWASHYLPGSTLSLADAARVPASWWAGYGGWPRADIVQYAGEAGRIAGTGPADLNVTDLTLADLHALAGNPTQEDNDMTPDQADQLNQLFTIAAKVYDDTSKTYGEVLTDLYKRPAAPTATVDAAALAAALAGNTQFVAALAEAVNANLAKRLES
jgi:hypothetical protein